MDDPIWTVGVDNDKTTLYCIVVILKNLFCIASCTNNVTLSSFIATKNCFVILEAHQLHRVTGICSGVG